MLRSEKKHKPSDRIIRDFDKITFSEYADQAKTTAVFPPEQAKGYLPWGILDELVEAIEKFDFFANGFANDSFPLFTEEQIRAAQDEIGDILWYVAVYADLVGIQDELRFYFYHCSEKVNESPTANGFSKALRELNSALHSVHRTAGHFKKSIRDDGEGFTVARAEKIYDLLDLILKKLAAATWYAHLDDVADIADQNLDKLFDRQSRGVLKGDGDNR